MLLQYLKYAQGYADVNMSWAQPKGPISRQMQCKQNESAILRLSIEVYQEPPIRHIEASPACVCQQAGHGGVPDIHILLLHRFRPRRLHGKTSKPVKQQKC
eukprot:scaffold307754_cov39-Prasinocladus_malaysianus.AAC.1